MLRGLRPLVIFYSFITSVDFIRQNLTSLGVRFWSIKLTPALTELSGKSHRPSDYFATMANIKIGEIPKSSPNILQISPNVLRFRQTFSVFAEYSLEILKMLKISATRLYILLYIQHLVPNPQTVAVSPKYLLWQTIGRVWHLFTKQLPNSL